MDFSQACEDDVLPFQWKQVAQYTGEAQRGWVETDVEYLHLFISDPKKQRRFWTDRLPRMSGLKYLEVSSRPNQQIFEAICEIPNLERLRVYWSNITDLRPIAGLKKLTHLSLGSSPKVPTLEPLGSLESPVALGLQGNFRHCTDLSPLSPLTKLRGLSLCGADYATQNFDSLVPLSSLTELVYFSLAAVRTKDRSLKPIGNFRKLKYLMLGTLSNWPSSEYQALYSALRGVECEQLRMAATCEAFRKANRIH